MENESVMFRQGDVLLVKIDSLPVGLRVKDKILAYGESTGHKHMFRSRQVQVFENDLHEQFVQTNQESTLLHEEHEQIQIPKGSYKVVLQREFDIISRVRQVLD
jgi:hypothetical protein